ncbi:MAG TPA: HpaII family restriction endonuclease [Tissierellales bacterium]|nr:HpaII family restriction endonuclease [Tissierellales bacterium]
MIRGNKGEWSEIYVLFRLLAEGKIYAADENLNKLEDIYFPIIEIIREETEDKLNKYKTGDPVEIYLDGNKIKEISTAEFNKEADYLLETLKSDEHKRAFEIEKTEKFMNEIDCYKISAPSLDKTDITMKIIDINTGYSPAVGFSIKSELGSTPTLLNAGKTTNFIFKIEHDYDDLVKEANKIYRVSRGKNHTDVKGRIKKIIEEGGKFKYYDMQNRTFKNNLVLIDSNMDKIIAETLLHFYRDGINDCASMVKKLEEENPMNFGNVHAYGYKFKKFLSAVALGMRPATIWDGIDEATGGYIIVTKQGRVVAYHIYNRNYFEDYLLNNTKYETASTSRHEFGELYQEGGKDFIKLNLQVRFI